jgi:hypothetical protein
MGVETRRQFAGKAIAALAAGMVGGPKAWATESGPARVAISLDLEMSRNFPRWEDTHWDYEKGNLDEATKAYTVEACRRVKAKGGVMHCFAVGRVFEQADLAWLEGIAKDGHPVGNHTYDHVNVTARSLADVQFRFQRSPWLVEGREPVEVIAENIRLCSRALHARLGTQPAGFRTPGGFNGGLADRPDVQQMIQDAGFTWVSSLYPAHPLGTPGEAPGEDVLNAIARAQEAAQPFVYPTGLIEIPMSPPSDISAFRGGRWPLESFLAAVERSVTWCIDHGAAFDFLGHPSCLCVVDPEFRTIDLILKLVGAADGKAVLSDLNALAASTPPSRP